jgi:hypothetical protein
MPSADGILRILDASAEAYVFPMLDNGYVYLAAARLSCFCGKEGWAVVVEVFGYSPRAGIPTTAIISVGEGLIENESADDFVTPEAFEAFRKANPFWRQDFVEPFKGDDWIDKDRRETMRPDIATIDLLSKSVAAPSLSLLEKIDAEGGIGEPFHLANVARALAAWHRKDVFCGDVRARVPEHWTHLLQLDEWRHPDLVMGECPSAIPTFQSIAKVIAQRDSCVYVTEEPNTHWSNWPEGGTL